MTLAFFSYLRGMKTDADIFKIQSNDLLPCRGRMLISEPFLRDPMFGRSVILLIDHSDEGSMGLVVNKQAPMFLNEVIREFKYVADIPLYKGGPVATDTLFYLHTLPQIEQSIPLGRGLFLNGDFDAIKRYVLQGNETDGRIRFFLGYSGWKGGQLRNELKENNWLVAEGAMAGLMWEKTDRIWSKALQGLGQKYEAWSRFPLIPTLN